MSNERNEVGFTAQHGPANDTPHEPQLSGVERSIFQKIADDVGHLVTKKNIAYGSAYLVQGKFLRLLFPEGVHPDRYEDLLLIVRIFDKQMRLARRLDMSGESPYQDISGYGILGVDLDSRRPGSEAKQHIPDVGEKV